MKRISVIGLLIAALLIVSVMPAVAERGDDTKRKSKNGKVEGTIDGINVTLEYGRPNVKERQIWGGLVPFDKVWRTGADEATTFTISKDVKVEGKKLAAGTYSLFTIPGEAEWTIIFNKVAKQWGAYKYDSAQDALRVNVKPAAAEHVEEMTFKIEGNKVVLLWEKLSVPFVISAAM
ncbi:DUF2911 domain-containing protein [Acidobacteriota bacterium]